MIFETLTDSSPRDDHGDDRETNTTSLWDCRTGASRIPEDSQEISEACESEMTQKSWTDY